MRRLTLAFILMLLCALDCSAQSFVRLIDDSASPTTAHPVDATHPLPTSATLAPGGSVAITSTVNPTGTSAANSTSLTAAIPAASTLVTLTAPSSSITVLCVPGGANLFISFSGAATTSKFEIPSGYGFTFTGLPLISSFSVIGDAAAGNYSVFAH